MDISAYKYSMNNGIVVEGRSILINAHITYPFFMKFGDRYLFGAPGPLTSFENLTDPLPYLIWSMILGSLVTMTFAFLLTAQVYQLFPGEGLMTPGITWDKIVLKTVCTLTEPESYPYFPRWSAGAQ